MFFLVRTIFGNDRTFLLKFFFWFLLLLIDQVFIILDWAMLAKLTLCFFVCTRLATFQIRCFVIGTTRIIFTFIFLVLQFLLICEILQIFFRKSFTISLYQSFNLWQTITNMDSLALIKFCCLQYPEVVATVVTERHRLTVKKLFEHLVLGLLLLCMRWFAFKICYILTAFIVLHLLIHHFIKLRNWNFGFLLGILRKIKTFDRFCILVLIHICSKSFHVSFFFLPFFFFMLTNQ